VTNRKGVSQVLALIVAASVLMMTALTLIMMATGSLGDFGDQVIGQSCQGAIDSQCTASGQEVIDAPGSCMTQDAEGNPVPTEDADIGNNFEQQDDNTWTVDC